MPISWPLLDAIARGVWTRYTHLRAELDRLVRTGQALKERRLPAFPSPPSPGIPKELTVTFQERYDLSDLREVYSPDQLDHPSRARDRRYYLGWSTAEGRIQAIPLEYRMRVEVKNRGGERIVAFDFTTTSAWDRFYQDDKPLQVRQAERQALRRLGRIMRAGLRQLDEGRPLEGERRQEWEHACEAHSRITAGWHLHRLRTSRRLKAEEWAWRAGDREALAKLKVRVDQKLLQLRGRCLGPIVLSRHTNPEEIRLKIAILAARLGILDERALLPTFQAIRDFLHNTGVDPGEIFGRAATGYNGDMSHLSFRYYLKRVARQVYQENHGGRSKIAAAGQFGGIHPWSAGRPALLGRLATEFHIDPHVARQWTRDGKVRAKECLVREETTAAGERVTGRVEIPASERTVWEALCIHYYDMRTRKLLTKGAPASEKKWWYRAATKPRGSLSKAREWVTQLTIQAGACSDPRGPRGAGTR